MLEFFFFKIITILISTLFSVCSLKEYIPLIKIIEYLEIKKKKKKNSPFFALFYCVCRRCNRPRSSLYSNACGVGAHIPYSLMIHQPKAHTLFWM